MPVSGKASAKAYIYVQNHSGVERCSSSSNAGLPDPGAGTGDQSTVSLICKNTTVCSLLYLATDAGIPHVGPGQQLTSILIMWSRTTMTLNTPCCCFLKQRELETGGAGTNWWIQGATDGREPISFCMGLQAPGCCKPNPLAQCVSHTERVVL